MSNRRSILATEEASSTPGSPLRRSTRIANSPAPVAAPAAATTTPASAVSRRRSSAAESTVSTPARISHLKRQSLSHEITLEERPGTPSKRATAKTPRAASKSPSAEPELKTETPAKRGRRPSISKLKEEEAAAPARPETPTRRRTIRGQSTSPSKDVPAEPATAATAATAKPRGRRASISQVNLEVIKETDTNAPPKKVGRPRTSTRRLSTDVTEDAEAKKEEKKPATRRSIRGRSASVDIPEEPEVPEISEAKPAQDLNPINEEEAEVEDKVAENQDQKKAEKQDQKKDEEKDMEVIELVEDEEDQGKKSDDVEQKKVDETTVVDDDDDEVLIIEETKETTPVKSAGHDTEKESKSPSLGSEPGSVFKSPVRRSPRLSGSPEPKAKESSPASSPTTTPPKKDQVTPRKSLRLSASPDLDEKPSNVKESPRRSLKLSLSESRCTPVAQPRRKSSSFTELASDAKPEPSPRRSLSLRVSESEKAEETKMERRRSTRLSESSDASKDPKESRKSSSFSDSDNVKTSASRLSKSLGESNILNTSNTSNANSGLGKTPTPSKDADAEKDSLLKRTPELINGSDGSFHLNLSIPTTNSIDLDATTKSKSAVEDALDNSGCSNTSDKENGDKLNVAKSPKIKRVSLSETSTPKLNASVRMHSFCEPMEVEFSTDVVVASAHVVSKTPVVGISDVKANDTKTSQNESVIEVDNENEFGSSPVKPMKAANKDVTQSEDEMESELMSSFVDEVLEETFEVEKETAEDKKSEVKVTATPKKAEEKIAVVSTKEKQETKQKVDDEIVVIDTESDSEPVEINDDEEVEVIPEIIAEKEESVPEGRGGSKRRKVETPYGDRASKALDDLINAKLQEAEPEESDEDDDDDYQPANEFVDDMASEGEEDTPSEDSNQIIDEGESLHSTDDEELDDDDDYENDSFVTDDDGAELLSGHEYDLEELEKPKKKRKSRIVHIVDSTDEEEEKKEEKKPSPIDVKKIIPRKEELKVEELVKKVPEVVVTDDEAKAKKIVVLQDIKIPIAAKESTAEPVAASVVINEEDNLKSLEAMKNTLSVDIPKEPRPSVSTPNNSMIETSPGRKLRRKTSISISDQIKIGRHSDGEITEKITKAVDFFVSTIKSKSGNVSLNVSLDYANNSASSADEASPRRPKRASLKKEDVENINNVVDQILETSVKGASDTGEIKRKSLGKKQKRRSSVGAQNTSLQDEFEVQDEPEVQNQSMSKMGKSKKRNSQEFKGVKEVEAVIAEKPKEKAAKKRLSGKITTQEPESAVNENSKRQSLREPEEESPKKKVKLHKSFSDLNKSQEVKTKKSKKEKRLSATASKSLDSAALDLQDEITEPEVKKSPPQKPNKKHKKQMAADIESHEEDVADIAVPSKKKKAKLLKAMERRAQNESQMLIEEEPNAFVTRSEITRPTTLTVNPKKRAKKVKPSPSNGDRDDTWSVQEAVAEKPSKRNKDKVTVKTQLEKMKKKMAPNDFKNQMIYDSSVKRMDSTQILKNKQKAGYMSRKQK